MREEEARSLLEARAQSGAPLRVVAQGDFRSIKRLLKECLDDDIPCMLGPCTVGG